MKNKNGKINNKNDFYTLDPNPISSPNISTAVKKNTQ
jgi:hypothetical protein